MVPDLRIMFPTPLMNADGNVKVSVNSVTIAADVIKGGFRCASDGHLHINTSGIAPEVFSAGFAQLNDGALCVALGGVIDHFNEGIPCTIEGKVVGQLNLVPSVNDAFIAGIAVGALGGVYFNAL